MNPSRSKFCEGPAVCADDPLPIHLRRYTMRSSEDPTGWNVGIVDGGIWRGKCVGRRCLSHCDPRWSVCFHCSSQIQCTTQSSAYVTSLIVDSLNELRHHCKISYDTKATLGDFVVHTEGGDLNFQRDNISISYLDLRNDICRICLITIVRNNLEEFTKREMAKAAEAQEALHKIGHPTEQ